MSVVPIHLLGTLSRSLRCKIKSLTLNACKDMALLYIVSCTAAPVFFSLLRACPPLRSQTLARSYPEIRRRFLRFPWKAIGILIMERIVYQLQLHANTVTTTATTTPRSRLGASLYTAPSVTALAFGIPLVPTVAQAGARAGEDSGVQSTVRPRPVVVWVR